MRLKPARRCESSSAKWGCGAVSTPLVAQFADVRGVISGVRHLVERAHSGPDQRAETPPTQKFRRLGRRTPCSARNTARKNLKKFTGPLPTGPPEFSAR